MATIEWVDATDVLCPVHATPETFSHHSLQVLFSVAGALQDSQLVHSERFTYHAAMCASELMDPKMDMGMRKANRNIVQERLDSGELPLDLDASTVLAVVDKLFQFEVE